MTRAYNTATTQQNSGGAVVPFAAGKNFLINGGFDFWQRGTSSAGNNVYLADRWWDVAAGTTTHSQDTDVPSGVPVQYSIKWVTSASSSYGQWYQAVEQAVVKTLRGKQVTYSAYVKTTSYGGGNLILRVDYSNSTDVLNNVTTGVSDTVFNGAATSSWTRITNTFTVPSDAVGLRLSLVPDTAQGSGVTVRFAAVQLELGSVATPFSRAGGTIQGELAACQRYYYRINASSSGPYAVFAFGAGTETSTTCVSYVPVKVSLRTFPTSVEYGGTLRIIPFSGAESNVSAVTLQDRSNTDIVSITFTGSGLTGGQYCYVRANNSSTAYLGISAEL
jgi:hypothetical protein